MRIKRDNESSQILRFIHKYKKDPARVLDIGCGHGRNLREISSAGITVDGVEANSEIAETLSREGFNIYAPKGIPKSNRYDALLMSHIVEHFDHRELLELIDFYLEFLSKDGILIIATPLLSKYFYDDFDHIKPYTPTSFILAFGNGTHQTAYRSRNKLELIDIWFRKNPYKAFNHRGYFIKSFWSKPLAFYNLSMRAIHSLTTGKIGKIDGWVGVFRRSSPA